MSGANFTLVQRNFAGHALVYNVAWAVVQEYQDVWFGNPVLDPALFTSCYAVQLDGFVQVYPPTIQVCRLVSTCLRCSTHM